MFIKILTKFGALTKTKQGYEMHRLHQDMEYTEMVKTGVAHTQFSEVVQALSGRFYEGSHESLWTLPRTLNSHVDTPLRSTKLLNHFYRVIIESSLLIPISHYKAPFLNLKKFLSHVL